MTEFATYGRQRVVWVSHMTVELGRCTAATAANVTPSDRDNLPPTCPLSTWPNYIPYRVGA